LLNGGFTSTISNSTGNTYSTGTGTIYNFSGGSFIAQTDYRGTSATACAKTNMSQGNAFAIVTLGVGHILVQAIVLIPIKLFFLAMLLIMLQPNPTSCISQETH
jgi:hypothetical protein